MGDAAAPDADVVPQVALSARVLVLMLLVLAALFVHSDRDGGGGGRSGGAALHVRAASRPRLFVVVCAHFEPGMRTDYVTRVLREYAAADFAAAFDVRVRVETDSAALAPALSAAGAPAPDEVHVWSLAELGGDPYNLPRMHREAFAAAADEGAADLFLFTEDDILVTAANVALYVARAPELVPHRWSLGYVRAELWGVDNATGIAIDNVTPTRGARVRAAPSGHLYAEPWSPYAAFYVADATELRAMREDPSDVWWGGFPAFDVRARFSVGYGFKFAGGGGAAFGAVGWRNAVLVPLAGADGAVHPDAVVWHLPRKYALAPVLGLGGVGSTCVADVLSWAPGELAARTEPLGDLPPAGVGMGPVE